MVGLWYLFNYRKKYSIYIYDFEMRVVSIVIFLYCREIDMGVNNWDSLFLMGRYFVFIWREYYEFREWKRLEWGYCDWKGFMKDIRFE